MDEDFTKYLSLINNCDSEEPLLSETPLGKCLERIALKLVEPSDLRELNQALNVKQLIPTDDGLARDYRGLAEVMGFNSIEIERFDRSQNPTRNLLDAFVVKNENAPNGSGITLNDLIKSIERIERFDIIDDFLGTLVKLANNYTQRQTAVSLRAESRDLRVAQVNNNNNNSQVVVPAQHLLNNLALDQLTIDDTSQVAALYDAFICHAPDDVDYAEQLISMLESYDVKCATADFLLPGQFEYDALIRCIELRCRKVIIILTPNFSRSKECEFQTKFASESAIRNSPGLSGSPRIIPILYEPCDDSKLPSIIKVMSKIDMTNLVSRHWQVGKLIRALKMQ